MINPSSARHPVWPRTLALLVIGLHLLSALWHVAYGGMNIDEGFYAVSARSVWQGDLPYRDFGYTQTPLLPYINGLLMQATGFGLFEQRAVNGLWGALTLLLAARWLARHTSPTWALGFVTLFSLCPAWMYFIHLGKTYAFTGLVVVAAGSVYAEGNAGLKKISLLALLGTLGVGCRLPLAPYFGLLWLAALLEWRDPGRKNIFYAGLVSLLWPALLVVPFYLAAPDAAYFWTFQFHLVSVPDRAWHLPWWMIGALAPAVWLGLLASLIYSVRKHLWPSRRELVLTGIVVLCLAANLLPRGAFGEYGTPLLPLLALCMLQWLWRSGASLGYIRHRVAPLLVLAATNLLLTAALQWPHQEKEYRGTPSLFLPLNAPAYNLELPGSLALARQIVAANLPAGQPFVGPMLILATETNRAVPPHLRMGASTVSVDFPPEQARKLNLATVPELENYFMDPAVRLLAFSKNPHNNYAASMPTFHNLSRLKTFSWSTYFQRDFLVAYEDVDFLLLMRRPEPTGADR